MVLEQHALQTVGWINNIATDSQGARPGDLLVSVLDPNHWDQHISVRCLSDEKPGVIEGAFERVREWNIALAETVTVEGGNHHRVELICELYPQKPSVFSNDKIEKLEQQLKSQFLDAQVKRFPALDTDIAWSRLGTIVNGWVTFPGHQGGETWRDTIAKQLKSLHMEEEFDTRKLVLSAETTGRLFRGVVPRRGSPSEGCTVG